MRKLILIKHASPLVDPAKSSEHWPLSDKGKSACEPLADALRPHEPAIVVASTEPKARETAELIASRLRVPTETAPDLHEHDRSNVPHMRSGEFISHIELFFRRPDELVLGQEAADDVLDRFETAARRRLEKAHRRQHRDRYPRHRPRPLPRRPLGPQRFRALAWNLGLPSPGGYRATR